jgi:hypothetical protein
VAQPEHLKAELASADAGQGRRDQPAGEHRHPKRNRRGRVIVIDPRGQDGTVTVDVERLRAFAAPPGSGASMGRSRSSGSRTCSTVRSARLWPGGNDGFLFRLLTDGQIAERVDVTLGKSSVNTIGS